MGGSGGGRERTVGTSATAHTGGSGLTVEELAEKSGVAAVTIRDAEQAKSILKPNRESETALEP